MIISRRRRKAADDGLQGGFLAMNQRVVAAIVITSLVSAGAEIMAEGNIHVYNTLRGRALAGVHGNTAARIADTGHRL